MKCPMIPPDENERIQALASYGLGPGRPLPALDPVVLIAARMFDMPVAAINMIGNDHVFFAASIGVGTVDMSRDVSFCAHAINQANVMVVPDSQLDDRFHDNPLVTGPANLRFYAGVPLFSPEGHALGALCVIDARPREFSEEDCERLRELAKMAMDRLELRRLEISTERSRRPFEEFARNSPTAVVWFDAQRRIVTWNQAAVLHGYRLDEGEGMLVDQLIPVREHPVFHQLIARAVATNTFDGITMPEAAYGLRKDGSEFELGLSLFCWQEHGQLIFNAHLQDITTKKREEEELHRLATTDLLTGLANRGRFYREVEQALVAVQPIAVLMLDLDEFKDVNDSLGHAVGDSILCEISCRLQNVLGEKGLVARIGGDEFAVLIHDVDELAQIMSIAQTLIDDLAKPIGIDHHEIRITASCGVALAPEHAQEALEVIGNADLALFHAKRRGGAEVCVFMQALRMEAVARRLYGLELHRAVCAGEFVLFYQPQIRLADGVLAGAEALIRWRHPERGLLSPAAFLPALENGPLAATVGNWVLDEACAQVAQWRRYGLEDFRMGVNLFGAQFRVDDLAANVIATLERHGLPPSALELEITENIVLEHDELVLESLWRLRKAGVGVAFDDFGTGYASLSLLKRYPLSRIKIDRSFVQGMLESQQDTTVINAVIDMAKAYSLETIAEGIETAEQQQALLDIDCAEGQGYLFSRPLPAVEFADMFNVNCTLPDQSRRA